MVVVYRMNKLTFALAKRLVKVPWVSLPNLLAGRELVPEFFQNEVNAQTLGPILLRMLEPGADHGDLIEAFGQIRNDLRRDASRSAASAIKQLLEQQGRPQSARTTTRSTS
jgi:lipid-A-disaccharide synthase